jgi:hypothetical protein
MKAALGLAAVLAVTVAYSLVAAADQPAAAVPTVSAAAEDAQPVRMVELTLKDGSTVNGRLVKEDDQTVQVTLPAGSSIGYARSSIQTERDYTLSAGAFAEQAGDYAAGQMWKSSDGAAAYTKARDQYQDALLLAATAEDRARVQTKVADLEKEREDQNAEAVRERELQKAKDEADLVKLQQTQVQQQMAALQTLSPRLQQLEQGLRQTNQAIVVLQNAVASSGAALDTLSRQIASLQSDVSNLQYSVYYAPYIIAPDRRSHDDGGRGDRGDRDGDNDRGRGNALP